MKKKTLLLTLTAVIMVAALAIGGTLAYFTSNDSATNTFTAGNVKIFLFEHGVSQAPTSTGIAWTPLSTEVQANTYTGIYPGAVLPKDPTIRNTGSSRAYVRMKITISNAAAWTTALGSGYDLTKIFSGFDSTKWTLAGAPTTVSDKITYVYNYTGILAASANTGALFTTVTIPSVFDNAQMTAVGGESRTFILNITAEAIQADGFADSAAAFTALNAQLNPPVVTP